MATEVSLLSAEVRLSTAPALRPVGAKERISSVDVVRGAALLGIALMNIVFSGLPLAADFNPKVSGGATGLNLAAFFLQYVLFDGKMRGLFSLMFGASTYLLVTRLDQGGAGPRGHTHRAHSLRMHLPAALRVARVAAPDPASAGCRNRTARCAP